MLYETSCKLKPSGADQSGPAVHEDRTHTGKNRLMWIEGIFVDSVEPATETPDSRTGSRQSMNVGRQCSAHNGARQFAIETIIFGTHLLCRKTREIAVARRSTQHGSLLLVIPDRPHSVR